MKKIILIFGLILCFINCEQKSSVSAKNLSIQKLKIQNISKNKIKSKNDYNCLTTLKNVKICDLGINGLSGKIEEIQVSTFEFEASPFVYNNKVAINRASSITSYILDYENVPKFLDKKTSEFLLNPKASYVLFQGDQKFTLKSFKILNLKPNIQYTFNAVSYSISTTEGKGKIIVIKNIKKYE